jgi:hypothetical protein
MASRRTEAEAREMARRLLEEAKLLREEGEARGERVESLDEETLIKKIMGRTANSPFLWLQQMGTGPRGGITTCKAFAANPDPVEYSRFDLFAYLFFGPSNFIQDVDTALTMVDTRFPRHFNGIDLAPDGGTSAAAFVVDIPSAITPGNYMANFFLLQRGFFDVGTYYDRAATILKVTP